MVVPPGGYVWWYVDALSDDGRFALTLIAFVGSVFSPYYAWSGWREPNDHCAINVALYGRPGARWVMTERPARAVERSADHLRIGPSSLAWNGATLTIDICEMGAPLPRPVRGQIKVTAEAFTGLAFGLDEADRHRWQPIAPRARVEVALNEPELQWSGNGYLDSNCGDEPLEHCFSSWSWSRAHGQDHVTVLYDAIRNNHTASALALRFDKNGVLSQPELPPRVPLPMTSWRVPRETRADSMQSVRVRKTLEDTPFYARSILETRLYGEPVTAIHESLSLERLGAPWVRALLPFRMPRAIW